MTRISLGGEAVRDNEDYLGWQESSLLKKGDVDKAWETTVALCNLWHVLYSCSHHVTLGPWVPGLLGGTWHISTSWLTYPGKFLACQRFHFFSRPGITCTQQNLSISTCLFSWQESQWNNLRQATQAHYQKVRLAVYETQIPSFCTPQKTPHHTSRFAFWGTRVVGPITSQSIPAPHWPGSSPLLSQSLPWVHPDFNTGYSASKIWHLYLDISKWWRGNRSRRPSRKKTNFSIWQKLSHLMIAVRRWGSGSPAMHLRVCLLLCKGNKKKGRGLGK